MNKGFFAGRIAKAPTHRPGTKKSVCYFTLIDDEYAGTDANGDRLVRKVALDFTAFGGQADTIADRRPGDQLIVEYTVQNTEKAGPDNTTIYGVQFVIENFTFGAPGKATREFLAAQRQGNGDRG